jgi:tryptophan-rich sensory protein
MKNFLKLLLCILICEGAGIIGSIFTTPSIATWYAELVKPSFNPPNYLFGPVWITLYLLMGISLYLIWNAKDKKIMPAVIIFAIQLILNSVWSIVFFGLHSPFYAFIIIVALWIFIVLSIVFFFRIRKTAAYLLIPYICWVSFAAVLNFAIFSLNS